MLGAVPRGRSGADQSLRVGGSGARVVGLGTVVTETTGYEHGTLAPERVESMFDRIAPVYDVMNRAMTAGLDGRWRRLTARSVVRPRDRVLDACSGTGDLAVACAEAGGRVTGLDVSERML